MFAYGNASKQNTLINLFYVSLICHNSSVTTTLSQLKICDFSGETFKGFEVL